MHIRMTEPQYLNARHILVRMTSLAVTNTCSGPLAEKEACLLRDAISAIEGLAQAELVDDREE